MRKIFIIIVLIAACASASLYEFSFNLDDKKHRDIDPRIYFKGDNEILMSCDIDTPIKERAFTRVPKVIIDHYMMKYIVDTLLKYNYFEVASLIKIDTMERTYLLGYNGVDSNDIKSTNGIYIDSIRKRLLLIEIALEDYYQFGISETPDSVSLHYQKYSWPWGIDRVGYHFGFIYNEKIGKSGGFNLKGFFGGHDIHKDSVAYSFFEPLFGPLKPVKKNE